MRAEPAIQNTSTAPEAIAAALLADLPRDQALGLRLLCLAHAAAAVHMGQTCAAGGEDCAAVGAGAISHQPAHSRPRLPIAITPDSREALR